jgi:hypothetical protein
MIVQERIWRLQAGAKSENQGHAQDKNDGK